ncbi:MAG TPA: HAD family hydrolase [Sphaerochaeta sp.]|nr:HAD family hydrolase [Sphaerochaeta sp.]
MGFLREKQIQWLALDIDGTLYPRYMLNWRMVRSTFPSVRLALAFNEARREYRRVQEMVPTEPASREGLLTRQAKLVADFLQTDDIVAVKDKIDSQFYGAWERTFLSIKAYRGLRETLENVAESGVKIALFSDFPIADKPETLGIRDLVSVALSSEESGYLKPSKHAFARLLAELDCEAEAVLYVGDSYEKDCEGAKRIGMYSALISNKSAEREAADLISKSWMGLGALLL